MRWHSRRVASVGVGMASSRAEAEAAPCRRGASRDGRRARRGLRRARQTRLAQTQDRSSRRPVSQLASARASTH